MSDRSALDWDAIDEVARKARERFAYLANPMGEDMRREGRVGAAVVAEIRRQKARLDAEPRPTPALVDWIMAVGLAEKPIPWGLWADWDCDEDAVYDDEGAGA